MVGEVRNDEGREASIRNDEVLRIVLVGKTGSGKSATGNTILGSEAFRSEFSFESVTHVCKDAMGASRKVYLVDTPGLFDTRATVSEDDTLKSISKCISLAAPGPHGFLLVIQLGRFTDEEQRSVEIIQKVFGEKAGEYTMILFTNGDKLSGEPFDEMLEKSPELHKLVRACKDRYHVFNNKTKDPSQVNDLLEKIKEMVKDNGGSHYTNEMFQEAARKIKEEKKRECREKEDKRRAERWEGMKADIKVVGNIIAGSAATGTAIATAAVGLVAAIPATVPATAAAAVALETAELVAMASIFGPVGAAVGLGLGIAIGGVYLFRKHKVNKKT